MCRVRTICGALALVALVAGPCFAGYVSTVQGTSGLTAYWRLESDYNSSVGGFTGTAPDDLDTPGTVSLSGAGGGAPLAGEPTNHCLVDNGQGEVVTTLTDGTPYADDGTFMAWVKFQSLPSDKTLAVVSKGYLNDDLDLQYETASGQMRFFTGPPGGPAQYAVAPTLGTWYHVTGTYDDSLNGGTSKIYWNGALVATATGVTHNGSTTNPLYIGESAFFGPRYFTGSIDEVSLWNRALTATEVKAIYDSSPEPSTIVLLATGLLGLLAYAWRKRK